MASHPGCYYLGIVAPIEHFSVFYPAEWEPPQVIHVLSVQFMALLLCFQCKPLQDLSMA